MKFGFLAVDCMNDLEVKSLCDFLHKHGYSRFCWDDGCSLIAIDLDNTFYDLPSRDLVNKERVKLTYQQFMDKYAVKTLKQKVEQVKREIGYKNLSQMSYDLGYRPKYLSNTLREGLTPEYEAKLIAKLDALLDLHKKELTHDFEGKSLNKKIDDAVMISKSELDSLKKEIDHKTQVAEKHADMRAKAEEKMLLAEQDSEKWQGDYWVMARENATLANELSQSKELVQSHFNEIEALNQVIENGKFALDGANSLLESNRKTYVKNIGLIRSRLNKERLWFCLIFILTIAVFIGISAT